LKVASIDKNPKLGGRSRESWAIENYLGYSQGIRGKNLYDEGTEQAAKFGAHIAPNSNVATLEHLDDGRYCVITYKGERFAAPSVVIASGLEAIKSPTFDKHEGKGITYGMPANVLRAKSRSFGKGHGNVALVGGGNSAGQAALKLSKYNGVKVHMIVRSNLTKSMSAYLISQIHANPNIVVHENTEIAETMGKSQLTHLKFKNGNTLPVNHLFAYIGAKPRKSSFAKDLIEHDERGFIKTGHMVGSKMAYETSAPGIFAIGDIRSGSAKRVSNAVGDAGNVIQNVHEFMAKRPTTKTYSNRDYNFAVNQPDNPCKYPWQKAADGSLCGKRASLAPKIKKFAGFDMSRIGSNIVIPKVNSQSL
jgi:thioredoxin reductase (NADPH)